MQENYINMIETKLNEIFNKDNKIHECVKYSLLAGGKRLRPVFLLEFCRICGGDIKAALPYACAIEMIHTYSLIHDDLPCMDNDDLRRGKPSNHIKFGQANALLAGDALLNTAFETMLLNENIKKVGVDKATKAAFILAKCAGINGMIQGQVDDLENSNKQVKSKEEILNIYDNKTCKLLEAASQMGCILGGANDTKINLAKEFAINLGLAFQIYDDILDITSNKETLGKPTGSDENNNKNTFVNLVGLEQAKIHVENLTNSALEILDKFNADTSYLINLTIKLKTRSN